MDSHEQDNCAKKIQLEHAAQIRALNDLLRVQRTGGQLFVTQGICSLGPRYVPAIIQAVTEFADFTADNDPYGEHDYGALDVLGHRICWKIDYWDRQMKYGSPNPADASVTTRILTIMLVSEY